MLSGQFRLIAPLRPRSNSHRYVPAKSCSGAWMVVEVLWFPWKRKNATSALRHRKRRRTQRHWRGLHDRGGGLAVLKELIEYPIEMLERIQVHLDDKAVFACDAVTFGHLWHRAGELGNFGQLPGRGAYAHVSGNRPTKRGRIQLEPAAAYHACIFQPVEAFFHRRRRHADGHGQARHRLAGIFQ